MPIPNSINMPEAEVSIRLAHWLLIRGHASDVELALDGAQVEIGGDVQFELRSFLDKLGWRRLVPSSMWQGQYRIDTTQGIVTIHSSPGRGDVVAKIRTGQTLRVECKKGPLLRVRSSTEYKLLREALGQLLTMPNVTDSDLFAAAVPHSEKFAELAARWRAAPLVQRAGIHIVTVDQSGNVQGLNI